MDIGAKLVTNWLEFGLRKENANMYAVPAMNGWPVFKGKVIVSPESLHEKEEFQEVDSFFSRAGMEPMK
jgi:hypothetical protein